MADLGTSVRVWLGVFAAGGCGASLRVLIASTLDQRLAGRWPYVGTLSVNLVGCFAIGMCSAVIPPGAWRPIIIGGLLGGFTTYSAFGLLGLELLRGERWLAFGLQVAAHVGGGLLCAAAGIALARAVGEPR